MPSKAESPAPQGAPAHRDYIVELACELKSFSGPVVESHLQDAMQDGCRMHVATWSLPGAALQVSAAGADRCSGRALTPDSVAGVGQGHCPVRASGSSQGLLIT